ncbi:uncharacterized protein [Procambarus clarkii]|uniref:uncharacterized protein n=1 Tax=Procambarus clarkii TaxID=6728 RepID=UPI001E674A78|nr:uncharacterized protein LOC123765138 [Procambarus clarkii]
MATIKKALSCRSTTYPLKDSTKIKARFSLRRMKSFDCSFEESALREERRMRDVSAEGRLRAEYFQYTNSPTSAFAPAQKILRFSDECWCGPAVEPDCVSPTKSKHRILSRTNASGNAEKLVDWQRHFPERRSLSPSSSQESCHRHSRASEKSCCRNASIMERRRQFCSSVSLPPSTKLPSEPGSSTTSVNSTTAHAPVSTEGRRRRSQFRKAWSLFSLTCGKETPRREKSPQQRILRPPTRHEYRRGLSGLPIQCSTNKLGLAY